MYLGSSVVRFDWNDFLKCLGRTALGGSVVVLILFGLGKVSFWPFVQANAVQSLQALGGAFGPDFFVVLVILIGYLSYMVLAGAPVADYVASYLLRPAFSFCCDAACLGVGLAFALSVTANAQWQQNLEAALFLLVLATTLHPINQIIDAYSKQEAGVQGHPPLDRKFRMAVSLCALLALITLYWSLP